ncbi:MAG: divergent polysaccharide deacetylase family protein [Kordiimonadaceae bacterium]|jgi:uncharacterized protein|nr:divergent polysaccharide deacetylase family protein [Kordiimonadaceae bacterium]MBT6032666.1 divergent polysaccharide deacetylase family protein [Kordiimonadaceae bacterium]
MADEPELKTTTRLKVLNPLLMAWAFIIILLSLTVSWVVFSEDPEAIPEEPQLVETVTEEMAPAVVATETTAEEPTLTETAVSATAIPEIQIDEKTLSLLDTQFPLSLAPNENLLAKGDNGMKPVQGPDGLIAWKEYARPYTGSESGSRIAIIITDIGLNTKSSTAAIDDLPGTINLAFSPYGRNLQTWMDKARAKGHEGLLMIPTEPINYPDNDPGPHTLISDFSARDNLLRLDWLLSQVGGYVGVVNHMGSKFTAAEEALTPVLEDLQSRGLMFVDARSTRFSMAARIARRINMPRAMNDRYLDNVITSEDIQRQLGELEKIATTFGAAVGLARATPLTIKEIALWAETLQDKGIELTPVTAVANRQPIK